jgi:hypothetical protein
MRNILFSAVFTLLASATAFAAVEVTPPSAVRGQATEYTIRVRNDTRIVTTSVQLDVPEGITMGDVAKPAEGTFELKMEGTRVIAVVWTTAIQPKATAEFKFFTRNPTIGEQIVWHIREGKANKSTTNWIGNPKQRNPAPITKLTASSAEEPAYKIDTR